MLKTDVFTKRHTQWYYFRVQNMLPGVIYKFRIVNLLKRDSLYNHGEWAMTSLFIDCLSNFMTLDINIDIFKGMRPLMYSERSAEEKEIGWIRHGHHIK